MFLSVEIPYIGKVGALYTQVQEQAYLVRIEAPGSSLLKRVVTSEDSFVYI